MNCRKSREIIDLVGDLDRLPPAAARHLEGCTACRGFGRDLVVLRALLKEPGRVSAPEDFDARLARRLGAHSKLVRRPRMLALVPDHGLAAAAAVVVLALGAVAVSRLGPVSDPDGTAGPTNEMAWTAPQPAVSPVESGPPVEPATAATPPVEPTRTVAPARLTPPRRHSPKIVHAADRTPATAAPREAMLLIQDSAGTRVVSVPEVLVGAERIIPAIAVASEAPGDGERLAF